MKFSSTFFVSLFLSSASMVLGGGGGGGGGNNGGGDTNISIEVEINIFVCVGTTITYTKPVKELCNNGQPCYTWGNNATVANGSEKILPAKPVQEACSAQAEEVLLGIEMDVNTYAQTLGFTEGVINVCDVNDPVYPIFVEYMNQRAAQGYKMIYKSSANTCARRRLKNEDFLGAGTDENTLTILEQCGQYEYEGFLHVTDHLYALAVPSKEAHDANCPHIAVHAIIGDNNDATSTAAQKEMIMWSDPKEFEAAFPSHGSMSFGKFDGHSLTSAYFEAETSNQDVAVYDVIKNSCGVFIVSLASELGVKVDSRVTTFVARRLMEHAGQELTNKIRESVYFPSFKKGLGRRLGAGNMENGALVEALVKTMASGISS